MRLEYSCKSCGRRFQTEWVDALMRQDPADKAKLVLKDAPLTVLHDCEKNSGMRSHSGKVVFGMAELIAVHVNDSEGVSEVNEE